MDSPFHLKQSSSRLDLTLQGDVANGDSGVVKLKPIGLLDEKNKFMPIKVAFFLSLFYPAKDLWSAGDYKSLNLLLERIKEIRDEYQ